MIAYVVRFLRAFWYTLVSMTEPVTIPLPRLHKGRHRRHCSCPGKPDAAYPGARWECPACRQVYVAEIYSGRVRWMYRLAPHNFRRLERRSA